MEVAVYISGEVAFVGLNFRVFARKGFGFIVFKLMPPSDLRVDLLS